jgi:hypothetical protein
MATVFACPCGSGADPICRWLPQVATTGLHKGSSFCLLPWLHHICWAEQGRRRRDGVRPAGGLDLVDEIERGGELAHDYLLPSCRPSTAS